MPPDTVATQEFLAQTGAIPTNTVTPYNAFTVLEQL